MKCKKWNLGVSLLLVFGLGPIVGCDGEDTSTQTGETPAAEVEKDSQVTSSADAETALDVARVPESGEGSDGDPFGPSTPPPSALLGDSHLLINNLLFPFEEENGTCIGFDLDEENTQDEEADPCGWTDYESPTGAIGVDNNLARLTPLFDSVGLGQAFQYLQDSIESSGFFLMFALEGVDDLENDPDIQLMFHVGGGAALLGTSGGLVADQTLCIQNDSPALPSLNARIENGWIYAEFESLILPLVLFERLYEFVFLGAKLQAKIHADGSMHQGVVGGVLTLDNILQIAAKGGQNQGGLYETVQFILGGMGDMETEEGPCTGLSSAFAFTALPTYVYPEEMDCDTCGNAICESFESCETCLMDCCPSCGNGVCDFFDQATHSITFLESGFNPASTEGLVGDKVVVSNESPESIHLLCDGFFDVTEILPGESYETALIEAGSFPCRTLEYLGLFGEVLSADNYSETCQSCPQDCPDGC